MPKVTCPKCKHFYEVDEADNGKECECPCGHEFKIEIVPEIKLVHVAPKPASRNKWKALLQLKAVIAICIICLLVACTVIAIRLDRKNPFSGIINSLEGIEPINRRSDALDEYLQVIIDKRERDRALGWELKAAIANSSSSFLHDELLRLKTQWEKHYNKKANPESDPLIKDAKRMLAQKEKELEELSHRIGLSNYVIFNILDMIMSPIDSIKYIKIRNQTVEAQDNLSDVLNKY